MKNYSWMVLMGAALTASTLAAGACTTKKTTSGNGDGGSGGGNTTTTTTTNTFTTTTTTTTNTGTTTTTTGTCDGTSFGTTCGPCLEGACCAELAACAGEANCIDCLTGAQTDQAICGALANGQPLYDCATGSCNAECIGGGTVTPDCNAPATSPSTGSCYTGAACNPVTNGTCTTGQACDYDGGGDFMCYDPPNDQQLCDPCGEADGWCAGGMTCAGQCVKFCCDANDCGAGATCDMSQATQGVGICIIPAP